MILNAVRGFCMALADSVPGVSGGTIAFLLGFYDEFIGSLNDLIKGNREERITAIKFLAKLGIGWIIGMGLAVTVLAAVFERGIYQVSSLFIGFIVLAIPVMIAEERECLTQKWIDILFIIPGILVVVALSSFGTGGDFDTTSLNVFSMLYIFVAGMVAISAMVLPGISGSTVLLTFGLYMPVISSVKQCLHFDFSGMAIIIALGLGVIAGVLVSLRFIKKALDKYRGKSVYTIIGMMIGSIYAITRGPLTLDTPQEAMSIATFSILFFVLGAAIVLGMQIIKSVASKKSE
jgi:putative membrane protein